MAQNSGAGLQVDPSVNVSLTASSILPAAAGALLNATGLGPTIFGYVTMQQIATAIGTIGGVSGGGVTAGTFGSDTSETGIYSFPSQVGIGTAGIASNILRIGGTTSGTSPKGIELFSTLVAAQNGDALAGIKIEPTLSAGAFTGVVYSAILIQAKSVAAFASPGDSSMISVGVLTGTGATNAYGILIAPPTGASNNYLWAHTTVATANVTSAGAMTLASTLTIGGAATFSSTLAVTGTTLFGGATAGNWDSTYDHVQFGALGNSLYAVPANSTFFGIAQNVYYQGSFKYATANAVSKIDLNNGSVIVGVAASGTINTAITWVNALTIANSGAVTLGASAGTAGVTIDGTAYGAGVASLRLNGLTSAAGANVGTLTNSPHTGNPAFWAPINIAGTVYCFPCFALT